MYQIPISLPIKSHPLPHGLETKEGCMKIFFLSAKNKGAPGTLWWIEKNNMYFTRVFDRNSKHGLQRFDFEETKFVQFWNVFGDHPIYSMFHSMFPFIFGLFLPFLSARHFKFHPSKKWRGFRNLRIVKSVGFSSDSRQGTFQPDRSSRRRMGKKIGQQKKHFGQNW